MVLNLIYGLVILVLSPWLLIRSLRTGRYRKHLRSKFVGHVEMVADGSRSVAWFHGVSVGEVHLLRQLIRGFRDRRPNWQIVVSSTTDSGLAEARKHFAELDVIAYPFDFSWAVCRTMDRLRPSLIVLAESELWPNFLRAANNANVPVVVVNGRMSPRTARRYARVARFARRLLFNRVTTFAMQSQAYADNLRSLGVDPARVRVTGSVKYDGVSGDRDNRKTRDLSSLFGIEPGDLIWVAGSTHDPEECVILHTFRRLRDRFRPLRLILVPRAPERFDEVAGLIESAGFTCLRRSKTAAPAPRSDAVILIDTLGELAATWGLATIGFTGGSLNKKRGGQSMIEPAGLGVPVLFGPHTWNFKDAVAGLLAAGGAIEIQDEAELEREAARLLGDPDLRRRMGEAARGFVQAQQGATVRTLDMMDEIIGSAAR